MVTRNHIMALYLCISEAEELMLRHVNSTTPNSATHSRNRVLVTRE